MATLREDVFNSLKKMFASDIIIRKVGKKKLKAIDTHNTQTIGQLATNYLSGKYSNLYSSSNMTNYGYNPGLTSLATRLSLFRDYELMEQDPIIASALDLYSEETTLKNEFGQILKIKTENEEIEDILHNLFYDILNVEFNMQMWVRNLVKYGDWFMKLEIAEKLGVVNVIPISAYAVTREEGTEENPHHVTFKIEGNSFVNGTFENYEMAHFRLLNDSNFIPYGKSMIEPARRIWKQLSLMEDAMLIHRIMRAPQKRIFKVDVGNIHPNEVPLYMKKVMDQIKKVPYMDNSTGDYNLKYNMQNITEDFYLPIRNGDSGTSIDTLDGLEYQAIDDIEYLRNKLMAALRIPKAFLGYEEGLNAKATLAAEDVRFARTIEKIQKIIEHELTKIAIIHLYVQGYDDEDLVDFSLQLTSPSTTYEQEKIELWSSKIDLADKIKEQKYLSSDWIYKNIYQINNTEKDDEKLKILKDLKLEYRHEQIKMEGNDPAKTGQHVDDDGTVRGVDDAPTVYSKGGDDSADGESTSNGDSVGRPEETNNTYGTDAHDLGRDPVGKKDRKAPLKLDKNSKKSTLDSVLSDALNNLRGKKVKILGEELLTGNVNEMINDKDN